MTDTTTATLEPGLVGSTPYELEWEPDGTSWTARRNLVDILERELVGPSGGDEELLPESPVTKYMLGKLAPRPLAERALVADDEIELEEEAPRPQKGDEERVADSGTGGDTGDDGIDDAPLQRGSTVPASMGLRFQLPADVGSVRVIAEWARYATRRPDGSDPNARTRYAREPKSVSTVIDVGALAPGAKAAPVELDEHVELHADRFDEAATGRRHVELSLCNVQPTNDRVPVGAWLFQTKLIVESTDGSAVFLPVRDVRLDENVLLDDPEERQLALQYRDKLEFAIGRTTSVDWAEPSGGRSSRVSTTWTPTVEVPAVDAETVEGVVLNMRALAKLGPDELQAALRPMHDAYDEWLDLQEKVVRGEAAPREGEPIAETLPPHLQQIAFDAIDSARLVAARLAEGIDFLVDPANEQARQAFAFMNDVMADQRVHSQITELRASEGLSLAAAEAQVAERGAKAHSWRMFQLGFVLMQLPALCDPAHERRSGADADVELLFFPTGGGKTEAYLGLAAFTFAIRRLQGVVGEGGLDGSTGVAVLMRYTLRLLTSQQFQRATTLVCAAELKRRQSPATWGTTPFRIGMWVGSDVTPKTIKAAKEDIEEAMEHSSRRPKTLQLRRCPWCGSPIETKNVRLDEDFDRVHVSCGDELGDCPFADAEGLPVVTTDEEIYRLTPAFVIGTVDKFARLAREGQAASIFGHVTERCSRHGFVHPDSAYCKGSKHLKKGDAPAAHRAPAKRLRPPDLVIQDELHLITSSLGTTVGLFENVIDLLCRWRSADGAECGPMIVASSATVRSAGDQIRQLYGRGMTVFPPQVLDAGNTFFSKELKPWRSPEDAGREGYAPGRLYLGLSTAGGRLTLSEIRLATLLLSAGQLLLDRGGDEVDPYMTLVAYFSALRELAGMARFVQDDVRLNLRWKNVRGTSLPGRGMTANGLNLEELTSRKSGTDITDTLDRMTQTFSAEAHSSEARAERRRIRRELYEANKPKKPNASLIKELDAALAALSKPTYPYDVVLATSMLQVGVDVTRLGLMMVVGQPKNTAEYIQASSRVGRDRNRPGLVVALGNTARPRDLVHYEQFRAFHENFYSRVESLSVTPYSLTALRRGIPAVLVSAARALDAGDPDGLSPEAHAGKITDAAIKDRVKAWCDQIAERARRAGGDEAETLARAELDAWLDKWAERADLAGEREKTLVYDRLGRSAAAKEKAMALVISSESVTKKDSLRERPPFKVPNSMREVQPEINILLSPDEDKLLIPETRVTPRWVHEQNAGGDDD